MPDENYLLAGYTYTDDITLSDFDEGTQLRPFVKCLRCGALVNNGGLSREKHDKFHDALRELFDMVSSLSTDEVN